MTEAPAPATVSADEIDERRVALEQRLIDADRILMQTVQTSLSMIGFGFTITSFFDDVASQIGGLGGGQNARVVGASLLVIGLLLLVMGTWTQSRYRRELQRRYAAGGEGAEAWSGLQSRFTPPYVAALLLMLVGVLSLGSVLLRWFF